MPSSALIFEIIGIDKASKAFKSVETSTGKTAGGLSKLKVAGVLAFAALAAGAVELAKKSVEKFEETGKAAITLQRILGGTAEEVSRLNFAAEEKGIDTGKLTVGFRALSKHITANDKAWKGLGVSTKDAQGKTKPFAELLPDIADKFQKMPAGTAKTALALKLFGKSGTDLLPLLNLGSDGLKHFGEESDKLGHTLSGPQLDAIKKNVAAHRQFKAALSGVEIQIGAALYPALTKILPKIAEFASTVAQKAIPVIQRFAAWFSGKLIPALTVAYQRIMPGVQKAFASVTKSLGDGKGGWQSVGNAILKFIDVASKVIAVVLPPMIRLWGVMIGQYKLAAKVVTTFASVAIRAFNFVANAVLTMASTIIHALAAAFGWVPGLGPKLRKAAAQVDAFKRHWDALHSKQINLTVTARANALATAALYASGDAYTGNPKSLQVGHLKPKPKARGGPVIRGTAYLVGEEGPELFVPGASGGIVPNGGSRGGGGGNQYITINLTAPGDDLSQARRLVALLQKLQQSSGKPLQIRTA